MSEQPAAGFYKGRAIPGSEQYGKTVNGHDQIALEFHVPQLNRAVTVFLVLSDAAAQYSIEKLRACGWQGDDITNLVGIDRNEVDISIKYESYNGAAKMKVDIYAGGGGGRVKLDAPMDDRDKRAFAARIKSLLKTTGAAAAPAAASRPANRASAPATSTRTGPALSDDIDAAIGKDQIPF